jgi:hypothetical protein
MPCEYCYWSTRSAASQLSFSSTISHAHLHHQQASNRAQMLTSSQTPGAAVLLYTRGFEPVSKRRRRPCYSCLIR